MDINKEKEAFEAYIKSIYPMGEQLAKDCGKTPCELYSSEWETWQAAKAQAVPDGYKVVPVNYECVWCGCTELDGWADETMIEAQEPTND